MLIAILNKSTKILPPEAAAMTSAVNYQMRWHVAPAYQKDRPSVVLLGNTAPIPNGSYVIGLFDDSDQAGALGWHTEDANGNVFGRVFCNPTLQAGYKVLTGAYSIASILSHEVIEAFVDPSVSDWSIAQDGTMYAKEACDPVESDIYTVPVGGVQVTVSNFVFPSWFDAQGRAPYDQLHRLSAPFTMDHGGYVVYLPPGATTEQQKFGEEFPEWKKATKLSELSRTSKRKTLS